MRRAAKVDGNQAQIVEDLRTAGWSVRSTAVLGDGFPDIIVGAYKMNHLFEVKDPNQPPNKRELKPGQRDFALRWGGQVHKIETAEEAVRIIIREATKAGRFK